MVINLIWLTIAFTSPKLPSISSSSCVGTKMYNFKLLKNICQQFAPIFIICMSSCPPPISAGINVNFFTLWHQKVEGYQVEMPVLQVLGFEANPHSYQPEPIIIRLSDTVAFLDAYLSPPHRIHNNTIICPNTSKAKPPFQVNDIVRLTNFSLETQQKGISRYRLRVKEMELVGRKGGGLGCPAQLLQHLDNAGEISWEDGQANGVNTYLEGLSARVGAKYEQEHEIIGQTQKVSIKIEDQRDIQPEDCKNNANINSREILPKGNKYEEEELLTSKDIFQGKQGIFVGRLLRIKMTSKQTKQGQLSVLVLGFLDQAGDFARIVMAGRIAIKQFRQLKKDKCYFVKGLQTYQNQKMPNPQIRIRQKQFRITEIPSSSSLCQSVGTCYFRWDHELNLTESERVDVVGVVEEIDDQVHYSEENVNKQVIRITVRNVCKSVRISFWADQIGSYKNAHLKKKEAVVLEDIKKKKNKFLDFTYESSIIRLDSDPVLKASLAYLLPEPHIPSPPKYISQIPAYLSCEQNSTKTLTLTAYLVEVDPTKLLYKVCTECKRKVESAPSCKSCNSSTFQYKYNCQLGFGDHSGGIMVVAFDGPAGALFARTAQQMSEIQGEYMRQLVDGLLFGEFRVGVQSKNLRFILRNFQKIDTEDYFSQQSRENIKEIRRYLYRK